MHVCVLIPLCKDARHVGQSHLLHRELILTHHIRKRGPIPRSWGLGLQHVDLGDAQKYLAWDVAVASLCALGAGDGGALGASASEALRPVALMATETLHLSRRLLGPGAFRAPR